MNDLIVDTLCRHTDNVLSMGWTRNQVNDKLEIQKKSLESNGLKISRTKALRGTSLVPVRGRISCPN